MSSNEQVTSTLTTLFDQLRPSWNDKLGASQASDNQKVKYVAMDNWTTSDQIKNNNE